MANEEHLKRLREGIAAWNKWRKENYIIPLLGEADLHGANLAKADLREAILWNANLIEANLTGADLENAYLMRADLSGANLREANLRKAILIEANLTGADLTGATGLLQWQINKADADKHTKLPPNLQRPQHWEDLT